MLDKISNANFVPDGRVYHVSVKSGQVANRIVTVGDPARLHRFKRFLDKEPKPFEHASARGYTTVTGRYKGVPVTLIAIGMGVAMVDFFVREVRAVVDGDLAIIRFGSCGSLDPSLPVGSIGIPKQALQISTNYAHWHGESDKEAEPPYLFSPPIPADADLQAALVSSLSGSVASSTCKVRSLELHASADCFYSSQGRIDRNFQDDNETLIDDLVKANPDCASLEMESAHLLHLSHLSPNIRAAACHMVFADRTGGAFIDPAVVEELEPKVGRACLDALVGWDVEREHPERGAVWEM
ncbi:hypothetical protein JCM3775_000906 [Rhodotorula graminis]|uniref:Nucleoside phosphorylase domain-containing protein n=1 Tax=Rhodotorula graminis (strain WP1) TaxID=578459 RepID=A0A0P9EJK6_RHOGW|nr:uncharacterized protein RHOBADRAFT_54974 [Rhodotorula graminis WP1]KPV73793.1 hypothetical protein RHOBADRAFT_54974 [Rhodotorula graminis WP1]